MTDVVLYGIKNCDTIKKARKWLADNSVDYRFHDYRADGVDKNRLIDWCAKAGWEVLLNRRGTTWRKLTDEQRESVDESAAIELMCEHPAMIKRPVLTTNDMLLIGFDANEYKSLICN